MESRNRQAERRENSFEKGRWPTRLPYCTTGVTQKYVRIALFAIRESDFFALRGQGQRHGAGIRDTVRRVAPKPEEEARRTPKDSC
jgi:hypothetical protein